jgi:phospholipid/cholesterol/gamma-HCH transport system substrate-binding protein
MIKQRPSVARLVAMTAFAFSCIGILLYLWLTFGGSVPLRPNGYEFTVKFPEATQLAQEADVRISGVNVGKVRKKTPDRRTGLTSAVIELDHQYAPIPRDTRAILRQKTLLGETYVELTPGTRSGPKLPDRGTLATSSVAPTVELDEIFRTFDPKTRAAFSTWLDAQGRAVNRGGADLNAALANLTPFAQDVDDVLRILNRQSGDTRALVRNTGEVFSALSERKGQLRSLITNSNRVFETTASRDRKLADTFVVFPTFLREARTTTRRVSRFAQNTNPLVSQLRPAARQLSPTLVNVRTLAPDLRGLFSDLQPLIRVSRPGLPALQRILDDSRPLLARFEPYLRRLQPSLDYIGLYKHEITALLGNATGATEATDPGTNTSRLVHYLRTTNPVNPEILAAYPRRLPSNRSNPYSEPGAYKQLATGLRTFGTYLCANPGPATSLAPEGQNPGLTPELRRLIEKFVYTPRGPVAPSCAQQAPLGRLVGQPGRYFPQLRPIPAP